MTQREKFEAWYLKTYPFASTMPGKFDREGGDYTDTTVNVAWQAFQFAQAAQPAHTAAIKTLEHLGYTYHGAEYWKPPLGKQPAQPGLPDCWVVLENGKIIGTHDEPGHIKGNAAIRYVPAQPAHEHAIDTSPGWRTIESAPKDEAVLLAVEFDGPGDWRIKCGWGDERGWHVWGASWKPTHWQPLPAAPSTKEQTE